MYMAKPGEKITADLLGGNLSWERLQGVVKRYCLALTGSSWDAEDLAQDTWLKAFGTLSRQGHQNAEAFMLRIAKNTWIDQARRKHNLSKMMHREDSEAFSSDEDALELELAFEALRKHLPPLQRAVFLLRDVFGYSGAEASRILETTEGAVKAALHRARLSLEAVRHDLREGTLPIPEHDDLKALLRSMAAACQSGDIAKLVALAQQDVVEPVVAVGIAQTRAIRRQRTGSAQAGQPMARMAA